MRKLTCEIGIGDYVYTGVTDLNIVSSNENLTDTCNITFPRKLNWEDQKITDLIKRGDSLSINIGYDGSRDNVLRGFVRDIKADIPVIVTGEDMMFKLKENPVKTSFKQASLKAIIESVIPSGIEFKAADIELGKFRINNATPAKVLNYLKEKYGIYSFFRNGILYSGLRYWNDYQQTHEFSFSWDIHTNHSLTYVVADNIKYKVVARSIDEANNKIEVEVGDEDGDQRTFHYYNIGKAELTRRAEQELELLKYDGYRGTFTTFGRPAVFHGDAVTLIDHRYPEREGTYVVKAVTREFGQNGYKQTIELDRLWT